MLSIIRGLKYEVIKKNLFNICLVCLIVLLMGVAQNTSKQLEDAADAIEVCQISERQDSVLVKCTDSQQFQLGILQLFLAIKNMGVLWSYLLVVLLIIIIKILKDNFTIRY